MKYLFLFLTTILQAQSPVKWAVEPIYYDAQNYSKDSLAVIGFGNDSIGVIDYNGVLLFKLSDKFFMPDTFAEGALLLRLRGEKDGARFANKQGKLSAYFERASDFSEGLAMVDKGDLCGYIDKTGNYVIHPQFLWAGSFRGGMAKVAILDTETSLAYDTEIRRWGYINKKGVLAIPHRYHYAYDFQEGLAQVGIIDSNYQEHYGFVDYKGKEVIKLKYSSAMHFSEGVAAVEPSNTPLWGFIDKTGKWLIEPKFRDAKDFREGLAAVRDFESYKWGFIDKTGKWVLEPKYYDVKPFSEGYALAKLNFNTNWIFIDKQGNNPFGDVSFNEARLFKRGRAAVILKKNDLWGYIQRP